MRVLGIDPGVAILGWSLVEVERHESVLHSYGCVRTEANRPLTDRLGQIYSDLTQLISELKPQVLALETLFVTRNAKTLAQVSQARGVILLIAGQSQLSVFEYAPRQIKMAVTGYGAADKRQMQEMLRRLLNLTEIPRPDDAADAVAVALCHTQYAQTLGKSAATV